MRAPPTEAAKASIENIDADSIRFGRLAPNVIATEMVPGPTVSGNV